jgi:hypothetical protein
MSEQDGTEYPLPGADARQGEIGPQIKPQRRRRHNAPEG